MGEHTIYRAAGGLAGLTRLAHAWHARVLADEVVAHAFSHGYRDDHVERLAAYLAEALGGPPLYTQEYGTHADVVRLHSGNGPHDEMNDRAIACFDQAIADVHLDADPRLRDALHAYWAWATTGPMYDYHRSPDDVPHGIPLPRWGWDGFVAPR